MDTVIPHWLTKQAEQMPNQIAIEDDHGNQLTFSQLHEKSIIQAKRLYALGIREHHHVGLLSSNCLDMVITIHALTYIGARIVFLNTRLTKSELSFQIEKADVQYIVTTNKLGHEKSLSFENQYTYEEISAYHPYEKLEVRKEINLADPFTMMFTSGTTGFPKAVIHTYGNHWWSAIGSLLNLGFKQEDKWLLPLPIFHVGGFSILIRSVIYGMHVYMLEKYERKTLCKIIRDEKITIASLVTLMLQQYMEDLKEEEKPSDLRTILLGGGAIPRPLLTKVRKKNLPVFQSYGMTETSSQIVTLHETDVEEKVGSSGRSLFPAQMKVLANDGEVGEIVVKGPMVFRGYYKNEAATRESFSNGWFHTGDLGYVDEEGYLFVVDRRSDLIISGGENIYPSEIEHALLQYPNIKEAAVVGKLDERWGQVPVAHIVLQERPFDELALQSFLQNTLASYKIPQSIHVIDELPRNATNKIMRHRLKE